MGPGINYIGWPMSIITYYINHKFLWFYRCHFCKNPLIFICNQPTSFHYSSFMQKYGKIMYKLGFKSWLSMLYSYPATEHTYKQNLPM
jgi:hypothetical protein